MDKEKLKKRLLDLLARGTLRKHEREDESRQNEAAAAAGIFLQLCSDYDIKIRLSFPGEEEKPKPKAKKVEVPPTQRESPAHGPGCNCFICRTISTSRERGGVPERITKEDFEGFLRDILGGNYVPPSQAEVAAKRAQELGRDVFVPPGIPTSRGYFVTPTGEMRSETDEELRARLGALYGEVPPPSKKQKKPFVTGQSKTAKTTYDPRYVKVGGVGGIDMTGIGVEFSVQDDPLRGTYAAEPPPGCQRAPGRGICHVCADSYGYGDFVQIEHWGEGLRIIHAECVGVRGQSVISPMKGRCVVCNGVYEEGEVVFFDTSGLMEKVVHQRCARFR